MGNHTVPCFLLSFPFCWIPHEKCCEVWVIANHGLGCIQPRHLTLVIVIFLMFAWFCILLQITLSDKLPLFVNFLLFMAIEIILTNKLTIVGFNLKLFQINTKSIPHFLAMILHIDFTVTFVLITVGESRSIRFSSKCSSDRCSDGTTCLPIVAGISKGSQ
jgi:hypothetical protein